METFLISITFSPVGAKKEGKMVLKHLPREKNVLNILSLINNLEKPIITNQYEFTDNLLFISLLRELIGRQIF